MRILCVAEKPSAAKQISGILSQGRYQTRNSDNKYIKNYDFDYSLNNRNVSMTMTSVIGHISLIDFPEQYRMWATVPIDSLFEAPIVSSIYEDKKNIASNLKREIQSADVLFIWTDCDREGEAIGFEVAEICRSVRRNIQVWRARFSAMQSPDINRAAQNPSELDMRTVDAVKARSELDLRIGAAFTRLQSLRIRDLFYPTEKKIISYGSCQFPTLGFIVDRYLAVQNFVPEKFWKLDARYTQPVSNEHTTGQESTLNTSFNWKRGYLFDRRMCFILYDKCMKNPVALVTRVQEKHTSKWKPLPLTTVEMNKKACRILHMTSDDIMKVAENLYTKGFISYPRTETDQFDANFDLKSYIAKQCEDRAWGRYAQQLLDTGYERPRTGRNNDKAHPPIHPTAPGDGLTGNDRRVYEFITRSFLATCSKDAKGSETVVEIDIADEKFDTKGLVILERNYLDIYTYDKWSGSQIPNFQQNQTFIPTIFEMTESHTNPPNMLTETDLIGLMEKNEIGTDATIHEHIKTVLSRDYAFKRGIYFHPTSTGIALVQGYDEIGFDMSLSKPFLRREMEVDLKRICEGQQTKANVVQQSVLRYRNMFTKTSNEFQKIIDSFYKHLGQEDNRGNNVNGNGGGRPPPGGPPPPPPTGPNNRRPPRPPYDGGSGDGGGNGGGRGGGDGGGGSRGQRNNNNNQKPNDLGHPGSYGRNQNNPDCKCGVATGRMTAQKEGPNKGREFYRCTNSQNNCGFFVWADEWPPKEGPNCDCNIPSVRRPVMKEGSNQGRMFYSCSKPLDSGSKRCQFFAWEDELGAQSHRAPPHSSTSDATFVPTCSCGELAIQRRVIKDGPNKGRPFFKCALAFNNDGSGCGFFEFQDDLSPATQAIAMNTSPTTMKTYRSVHEKAGSSSGLRKACHCGLTAITKKITKANSANIGKMFYSCPQESKFSRCNYFELVEDATTQARPAGNQLANGNNSCYHCGKPGHYASSCPTRR